MMSEEEVKLFKNKYVSLFDFLTDFTNIKLG